MCEIRYFYHQNNYEGSPAWWYLEPENNKLALVKLNALIMR